MVKTEEKTFAFPDEIQKIIVMGQGVNSKVSRGTIEHAEDIAIMKNAMQNANILTEPHTDEGLFFKLEVIYENDSKDVIDVWYYASSNRR